MATDKPCPLLQNSLVSSTMSEIEKEKVNEIFNELQEENTKLEATTEGINLGSSTDKNEVDALENQVQGRKKRDIQENLIERLVGETVAEETMEISEATLDDPNASPKYFLRVFYEIPATTENNLLGSSADKNEVDALENQVQRRKKRDIHSMGNDIGLGAVCLDFRSINVVQLSMLSKVA